MQYFDVSLRDGLQDMEKVYTLEEKIVMLETLLQSHLIRDYEIGSFASRRRLPQMAESDILYQKMVEKARSLQKNLYLLIFNTYGLEEARRIGLSHFSFITSASSTFLLENVNQTKEENLLFIQNAISFHSKIYLSCLSHDRHGPIPMDETIALVDKLLMMGASLIALSDTYGCLDPIFLYHLLVEMSKRNFPLSTHFSLHLHQNPYLQENIQIARDFGISHLDTSFFHSGGCIVLKENYGKSLHNLHILDTLPTDHPLFHETSSIYHSLSTLL